MSLPLITMPAGLPAFLAAGHGMTEDSVYAQVAYATGHSRARRLWTVTERVVSVSQVLEADELQAFDDWFEDVLRAGELEFSARVRSPGDGVLWWRARWIGRQIEMLHRGRGRVSGQLLLTGEGSASGPLTGALSLEIVAALMDVRSAVSVSGDLALEVTVALLQATQLQLEVFVELQTYQPTEGRATESGDTRLTEDGDSRSIEG